MSESYKLIGMQEIGLQKQMQVTPPATGLNWGDNTSTASVEQPKWLEWLANLFKAIFSGDFSKIFSGFKDAKDDQGNKLTDEEKKGTEGFYKTDVGKTALKSLFGEPTADEVRAAVLGSKSPEEFMQKLGTKKEWHKKKVQIYARNFLKTEGYSANQVVTLVAANATSAALTVTADASGKIIIDAATEAKDEFKAAYAKADGKYQVKNNDGTLKFDEVMDGANKKTVLATNLGLGKPAELLGLSKAIPFDHDGNANSPVQPIDISDAKNYEAARNQAILAEIKLAPSTNPVITKDDGGALDFATLITQNEAVLASVVSKDLVSAWVSENAANIRNEDFTALDASKLNEAQKKELVKKPITFKIKVNGEDTAVTLSLEEIVAAENAPVGTRVAGTKKPEDYISKEVVAEVQANLDKLSPEDKKQLILTTPQKEVNELKDGYDLIRAAYSPDSKVNKALVELGVNQADMKILADNLLEQMRAGLDISQIVSNNTKLQKLIDNFDNDLSDKGTLKKEALAGHKSPLTAVFPKLDKLPNPPEVLNRDVLTSYRALTTAYGIKGDKNISKNLEVIVAAKAGIPQYSYAEHLENIHQVRQKLAYAANHGNRYNHAAIEGTMDNEYQRYIFNTITNHLKEDDRISSGQRVNNRGDRIRERTELELMMDVATSLEKEVRDNLDLPKYNDYGDVEKRSALATPDNMYLDPIKVKEMRSSANSGFVFEDGLVAKRMKNVSRVLRAVGCGQDAIDKAEEPYRNMDSEGEKERKTKQKADDRKEALVNSTKSLLTSEGVNLYKGDVKDAFAVYEKSLKGNDVKSEPVKAAYNDLVSKIIAKPGNLLQSDIEWVISEMRSNYERAGGVVFEKEEKELLEKIKHQADALAELQVGIGSNSAVEVATSGIDPEERTELDDMSDLTRADTGLNKREKEAYGELTNRLEDYYDQFPKETAEYLFANVRDYNDFSSTVTVEENTFRDIWNKEQELKNLERKKEYASQGFTKTQAEALVKLEFEEGASKTETETERFTELNRKKREFILDNEEINLSDGDTKSVAEQAKTEFQVEIDAKKLEIDGAKEVLKLKERYALLGLKPDQIDEAIGKDQTLKDEIDIFVKRKQLENGIDPDKTLKKTKKFIEKGLNALSEDLQEELKQIKLEMSQAGTQGVGNSTVGESIDDIIRILKQANEQYLNDENSVIGQAVEELENIKKGRAK